MSKNIYITGISGFIGTASARYFLSQGYNVTGLVRDRNMKTQPEVLDRCNIVIGDILDKELVRSSIAKYEADYVLHLAAMPIVRICDADPYSTYMTNAVGTLNVLEAIRNLKKAPSKVIVMTSDKAYGPQADLPYKEESPLVVADSYCTSKACQDMISRSYAQTYNLPIIIVRAGNIYGPGDLNISRLIPNSILKLLRGESPTLYSGVSEFIREFIFIDNITSAYEVLFEKGVDGDVYNVGGTPPVRILDVIEMIRDKVDPLVDIKIIEKDFFEIKEQYLDATKLKLLGWNPKIELSEGLDKTIEWFKEWNDI